MRATGPVSVFVVHQAFTFTKKKIKIKYPTGDDIYTDRVLLKIVVGRQQKFPSSDILTMASLVLIGFPDLILFLKKYKTETFWFLFLARFYDPIHIHPFNFRSAIYVIAP